MAEKLWQYLDAVSAKRDASILQDPDFEKEYQPFIINRALSYHDDAILAVNLLNERPLMDKRLQALFLIHTLRPRRRFAKWLKSSVSEDVRNVAEYYGCSIQKARDLVGLHSEDQMAVVRARLDRGGIQTKGSRNASTKSAATRRRRSG